LHVLPESEPEALVTAPLPQPAVRPTVVVAARIARPLRKRREWVTTCLLDE
jgi:hypothetical protein